MVAHVVGNAEGAFTVRRALPGLLAHRFNVAAWLYDDGRRRGAASPAELVARLRESAGNTFQPPGRKPADVLADVIIHCQDAFVPLGIDRHAGGAGQLAVRRLPDAQDAAKATPGISGGPGLTLPPEPLSG